MNIILVGMPGSGKTSVADVFRSRGKKIFDTDALIVEKFGDIQGIFQRFGEEYFRNLETQTVKELAFADDCVIATGGGCVLRGENVEILKSIGTIVYLKTSVDTLLNRVNGNADRPLLNGDKRARLERLYNERRTVYENTADIIVVTDGLSPERIADKITEFIK